MIILFHMHAITVNYGEWCRGGGGGGGGGRGGGVYSVWLVIFVVFSGRTAEDEYTEYRGNNTNLLYN